MKKSFTLLEVVISITIFMILLLFLYKVLDQTKYSNVLLKDKKESIKSTNHLYNIFFEDIAELSPFQSYSENKDKNKNSIVKFISSNTYHNAFFTNITYFVSRENNLIRMESLTKFKGYDSPSTFYDNAYIDILLPNIEYFEVSSNSTNKNLVFVVKQKDKKKLLFNTFRMRD